MGRAMSSDFVDYALRQLQVLGPVVARRMFGAHGLYCDERIFALIDNDTLYFKVDALSRMDFITAGMGPFMPLAGKKTGGGYYELPLEVLESREKLAQWGRKALAAAAGAEQAKAGAKKRAQDDATQAALDRFGPVAQRWLADAGVRTGADLERIGSVGAFKKVAQAGHEPSANLLYALEGALLGLRPDRLSEAVKQNLLERAGLGPPKRATKPRAKRPR
jgi:DNA transformation protein